MTTQTIYYKPQIGKATKDVLREISPQDQAYVKKVMTCYQQLTQADPRPEFAEWFNLPNKALPKLRDQGQGYNTAWTWTDGIISKLNQAPNRRDLSPQQCDGIEALSQQISEMYDDCPDIRFLDASKKTNIPQTSFGKLFKR